MSDTKFSNLNFSKLITEFKQENFKKMPILHHEFIYACFHPLLDDCVIALEKNYYPTDSELYTLVREEGSFYAKLIKHLEGLKDMEKLKKLSQLLGIDKKILTIITEEGDIGKQEENKQGDRLNSKTVNLTSNNFESASRSEFSDGSNSQLDIGLGPDLNLQPLQKNEDVTPSQKNISVIDIQDVQVESKNSIDLISDAIKLEILKRMNASTNQGGQQIGGKSINQIVTQGFRPALMRQLTHKVNSEQIVEEVITLKSDTQDRKPQNLLNHHNHVRKSVIQHNQTNMFTQGQTMEENPQEFNFQEPFSLREDRLESTNKKKYGISIWKLNRGQQAYQMKEHPFNFFPVGQKFFISHDSKHIVVFLMNETNSEESIDKIRILDLETLKTVKEIEGSILLQVQGELIDSSLVWDSSYLYIQTKDFCYFINVSNQKIENIFELSTITQNSTKSLKHSMFRESDPLIFFSIVQSTKNDQQSDDESMSLYRVSVDKSFSIFDSKNFYMHISQGTSLDYNGSFGYNKYMSHIVFPGEQIFYIFHLRSKQLKSYRNVQNCQVNKNSFLQDNVWICYNDDNYDTFTISTTNLLKKYHLSDLDLDDFRLGDITREREAALTEQCIFSIGKKGEKEASSKICINVTKPDGSEPFINYIQETSDYVFAYPFIVYCKGNAELFIQSLHQPERLIKLDLEDQFVCFIDLNNHVRLKPLHMALGLSDGNQQFRKYESIAFLTQNDDQIFLNIFEYTPYGYDKQYTLYKSTQSVQRPKNIYKFPMIYMPSKDKNLPDVCFFASKDGYSTKIERIGFNGKEFKDPISTAYELKTSSIFIFSYHEGYFYIMDDTLALKQFIYDKRTQKFKFIKMYEFSVEYRDILAQPVDYDDIQVTSKGVYRGLIFMPFYEYNIYNKDINLVKTDPVLNVPNNDLFSGPKKQHGTQYMLYIARGDHGILNDDFDSFALDAQLNDIDSQEENIITENDQDEVDQLGESMKTDIHNIPLKSPNKSKMDQTFTLSEIQPPSKQKGILKKSFQEGFSEKDIKFNDNMLVRSKSIHRPSNSVQDQQTLSKSATLLHSKTFRQSPKSQTRSPKFIEVEKKLDAKSEFRTNNKSHFTQDSTNQFFSAKSKTTVNDKSENQQNIHEQVYAWVVPFLDSNVIHLTHNFKENTNQKYQITFSTFLNGQDEIICQINQVFYLYSKNGTFLYQINSFKNGIKNPFIFQQKNLVLENMSTNLKYFMFYDETNKQFEIYQLLKDKIDDQILKQTLTKQKYQRLKTSRQKESDQNKSKHSQFNSGSNSVYDRYCQPYILQFVKTVKEFGSQKFQDDYFNQRHISNNGQVYQMVQVSVKDKALQKQKSVDKKDFRSQRRKSHMNIPDFDKIEIEQNLSEVQVKQVDTNVFEFYIDEEQKAEDFNKRFQLIKEHLKTDTTPQEEMSHFGFQILGDFLFIKRANRLEYLKIFEKDKESGQQKYIANEFITKAKFVHFILDKDAQIQRLMTTSESKPELFQIIVSDNRFLYVVTWDIIANIEHQMMQIQKRYNINSGHVICKGMTERHNYIPIDNQFYDLYFGLPFKFFQNINQKIPKKAKMNMNERKFSTFNKEYIDLFEGNKVYKSYTYLDLCYLKAIQSLNKDQIDQTHIMIQHMHVRIYGQTIFSFIAQDFNLLKEVFDEVKKVDEQLGGSQSGSLQEYNSQKMVFIHILYPNFQNISAFDIAMIKKSPKSIELMLDMLCTLANYSLSKYFMHHFSELFQMELVSFQNFLSSCLFQLPKMKEIRVLKWIHNQDEFYIDYHTSYLGETFYKKIQNSSVTRILKKRSHEFDEIERDQTLITQRTLTDESDSFDILAQSMKKIAINDGQSEEQMLNQGALENMQWKKEFEVGELKRVETLAVEFDWIFRGKNAISFIEHLAHNANDSIFNVETIKIIVLFLWDRFFYHIRNKIFIPFMLYFATFLVQVTLVYEKKMVIYESKNGLGHSDLVYTEQEEYNWHTADLTLIAFLIALWVYFFQIEVKQCLRLKTEYFADFWNWLDMASCIINLSYFICDLTNVRPTRNRIQSSCAIILMWMKLLYFLRLFASTAALIRMIVEILRDMIVFTVIYFIAIFGFANAFFILAYNLEGEHENEMFRNNPFMAILYTYRAGLGDFNTTPFENSSDNSLWYFFFIIQTLLIQVVLLNLLIAIMGDTFDKVQEKREESKLREICEMISDYEGIIDREKEFRNSKYIIVTKLEKAQTNQSTDWEGRLASLKNTFSSLINEMKKETKQQNENVREEIIGNNKAMEQKFLDLQSIMMKQSSQVVLALKKIDKVHDKIKKIHKKKKNEQLDMNQIEGDFMDANYNQQQNKQIEIINEEAEDDITPKQTARD